MLVLSRFRDEIIVIILPSGEEINVEVVDIRGDKVRLGTHASSEITVHRKEVWEAIKREKRVKTEIQSSLFTRKSKKHL